MCDRARQRPNILFLLSDEHSFRFMNHQPAESGGESVETPAFDRLAGAGTRFQNSYCQMPLCTPSRLSMLTGREVRGAGAWENESVLRPELPTMGSVLSEAGYQTALIGKMHLGGSVQYAGFRRRPYGDLCGKAGHQWEPLDPETREGMRGRTSQVGVTAVPESLLQEQVVAQETIAFIREQRGVSADGADRPWFALASFSRPHFPLTAPKRWLDYYRRRGVSEPRVPPGGDAYDHPMSRGMRRGFQAKEISHEEMMEARSAYFACVSYLDEVIGDMLTRLEAHGDLDNTVIIYSSDHGELAGEHGVWWKHGWYEGCTRVPLILSTPAQRRGEEPAQVIDTPVGLTDLLPTLCDLAETNVPDGAAGRSLLPAPEPRPIVCDNLHPRWGAGTEFRMVREGRFKYVRFREAEALMFDLETDPEEQHNLASRPEHEIDAEALAARDRLRRFCDESMDFRAAERERTERDADLHSRYALDTTGTTPNLYHLPDGRVVNAEDTIYSPTVFTDDPARRYADAPE